RNLENSDKTAPSPTMSSHVVPVASSEMAPVLGIEELESHLDQLVAEPETPLNAKLIDDVELQLNGECWPRTGWLSSRMSSFPNMCRPPP
ncbi:hypothetical protein OFC62_36125, partial [Escherichia coli]|nr:hypothetical protein [Escherichia coli]